MSRPLRFTFILVLAAFGTGLAAVGGWRYARASAPVSGPIIVISIDTLKSPRYKAHLERQQWDAVVIDESHNLIGEKSFRNKLARRLAPRTDALLLASKHSIDTLLAWSRWRRQHQYRARQSHYRRRENQ